MYKCLCTSARNALRCRESALQLLCEATLELDGHNRKLHEIKVSHTDPSKRSIFQRMSGGGDAAEQIAKYEAKVAAEADLLSTRRQCYSEVRSLFRAIFFRRCFSSRTGYLTRTTGLPCYSRRHGKAALDAAARFQNHDAQLRFESGLLFFDMRRTSHVTHHASHVSLQH